MNKDCVWESFEDKFKCQQCDFIFKIQVRRNCPMYFEHAPLMKLPHGIEYYVTQKKNGGPGTELSKMLSKIGISEIPGCGCRFKGRIMDVEGADWCDKHIEEILDWLEEEALRRGLPFIRIIARKIVRIAIKRSRR